MATMYSNALTRLSPGVYRNTAGKTVYNTTGKVNPVQKTPAPATPTPFNAQRAQTRIDYLKHVRPNDAQIGQLQGQIAKNNPAQQPATPAPFDSQRVQTRIDYLNKVRPNDPEIAKLQKRMNDYNASQPQQQPAPTPPQPNTQPQLQAEIPQQPAQAQGSAQSPMTQALMQALGNGINTMQAYEPKNFEGSPLYQFQKQKGMQDLEKLMAARGLTNSGAEVQANSDFLANLNATEAEKQRQYADQASQRAQNALQFIAQYDQSERGNLINQQQFEANRDDRRRELGVNFLNNILGLQSQNDIARNSLSGLGAQTDLTKALMQSIANGIMSSTPRYSGGGAGPAPMAPSSSANDAAWAKILMDYGNRAGNNDAWNNVLKQFGF